MNVNIGSNVFPRRKAEKCDRVELSLYRISLYKISNQKTIDLKLIIIYHKSELLIRFYKGEKMVQYKKDEVKESIDIAALAIFFGKGYANAKIADIAAKAGISVGNLYRYYKNKDELFYTVVPRDFVDAFKGKLYEKITVARHKGLAAYKGDQQYKVLTDEFYEFLIENKERFIILVEHGRDTDYSGFKGELVEFFIKTITDNFYDPQKSDLYMQKNLDVTLRIIYSNLINLYCDVLKQKYSDSQIKVFLQVINSYHIAGIKELVE
ncbi:MAG: TetR/AcrR family transcriptional regulator [Clostridia bacterium]|nr:TetR/AcrR family transcriptional regulator [Clostridia bacterium]